MNDLIRNENLEFETFCKPLIGFPVSRWWQGYGSAIFLEFGKVQPRRRRDGSPGSPRGEWTLMIEWSWRIEGKRLIWCGSWSDGERWPRALNRLLGAKVTTVRTIGRLPEIELGLSNGMYVVSFMTSEGGPEWVLFNRQSEFTRSMNVKHGRIVIKEEPPHPFD